MRQTRDKIDKQPGSLSKKMIKVFLRGSLLNLLGLWKPCFLTAAAEIIRDVCLVWVNAH